ncbi:MAG TPA: ABC transporter permease [Patescibacteria group bacterium]|nr:ABC transporter permease [Patescibacteria group bacterium]
MNFSRIAPRMVQAGFAGAVLGAWHLATSSGQVSPLLLPPLASVYRALVSLLATGNFWPDLRVTGSELLIAFSIAAIGGCVIGYLVGRSGYAVQVFDPLFAGLYSIPAILLFPLYVLFFGIGPGSKIAMGITIAFFPVVLSTIAGLRRVDRVYISAARSMGASGPRMFWRVMLPAAFPVIFAGLRMGLILAFLAILGTEMVASFAGLGHRIVDLAENMDSARMFAYVVFVVGIAFLLNVAVSFVDARLRREAL